MSGSATVLYLNANRVPSLLNETRFIRCQNHLIPNQLLADIISNLSANCIGILLSTS